MKYLLFIFFAVGMVFSAHAQSLSWYRHVNFGYWDERGLIVQTQDSGFFAVDDSELVKLNKYGNQVFRKKLDYPASCIIQRKPGRYLLFDPEDYYKTYRFFEIDERANIVWSKEYITGNVTDFFQISPLNHGNFALIASVGKEDTFARGAFKMCVQKFDSNHLVFWSDTFNYGVQTFIGPILEVNENEIVFMGATAHHSVPTFLSYTFLMKLDSNGKQLKYNKPAYPIDTNYFVPTYIGRLKNGRILYSDLESGGYNYFHILDSNLVDLKDQPVSPGLVANFVTDADSVYILTKSPNLSLVKLDNDLNVLWSRSLGDSVIFNPIQLLRTSDGGLLAMGGTNYGLDTTRKNAMFLMKFDANGNLKTVNINNTCHIVYPNPASNTLHIQYAGLDSGVDYYLSIYSEDGKLVQKNMLFGQLDEDVDIRTLAPGIYIYRYYDALKEFCTGKFLKE